MNQKGVDLNLKGLADLKGTVTGYFLILETNYQLSMISEKS